MRSFRWCVELTMYLPVKFDIPTILTVLPPQAKCHQYWPEVGSLNLGDITVTLIEVQQLAYYTVRTFRMSRVSELACARYSYSL